MTKLTGSHYSIYSAFSLLLLLLLSGCFDASDSLSYNYILRVPEGVNSISPAPLIIAMHGYSDTNSNFESTSRLTAPANARGYIVVYPQSHSAGWNSGGEMFDELTNGMNDVAYILKIIDLISESYDLDESRIYLTGHSNGAFMAYHLAATVPSRFAAIAPVAGTMMVSDITEATPVSIIHVHGLSDSVVPYEGSNYYSSVSSVIALWRDKNGCDNDSKNESLSQYSRQIWTGSSADISLYLTNGLAHTWPSYATEVILDFFDEHSQFTPSSPDSVSAINSTQN